MMVLLVVMSVVVLLTVVQAVVVVVPVVAVVMEFLSARLSGRDGVFDVWICDAGNAFDHAGGIS